MCSSGEHSSCGRSMWQLVMLQLQSQSSGRATRGTALPVFMVDLSVVQCLWRHPQRHIQTYVSRMSLILIQLTVLINYLIGNQFDSPWRELASQDELVLTKTEATLDKKQGNDIWWGDEEH